MEYIKIKENGINVVFGITKDNQLKLLHFSYTDFNEEDLCRPSAECKPEEVSRREQYIQEAFQLVQVNLAGYNRPFEKHGNKHIVTAPGYLLRYVDMEDTNNEIGRKLVITQEDTAVTKTRVVTTIQFYKGTSVVRFHNQITNIGTEAQTLEYISSFCYTGIEKEGALSSDNK
ncbi:MAG TPA: alpha-galactosidase, partial [Lachnospiraceae bacterium]|nr:alpha-galactosidase [Lachnospiraceae bacterium]